jgi:hypothetical protein
MPAKTSLDWPTATAEEWDSRRERFPQGPPPGGVGHGDRRFPFPRWIISGNLCLHMQGTRDESIWKNLALAFGDGLAFGVGAKISQDATARLAGSRPDVRNLAVRLAEIEARIERARHNNALPGQFNQKVVEAVVSVVDARLREQADHFERRLTEEMAALRAEFSQQITGARQHAEEANELLRSQMTALHRQFAESLAQLVNDQIAATVDVRLAPVETNLRQEIRDQAGHVAGLAAAAADEHVAERMQPVEEAVAGLSQRLQENDRNTLELVLALGQICLQTAERLSVPEPEAPAEAIAENLAETIEAATPEAAGAAGEAEQESTPSAAARTLWRIPMVSSFFVATGGLLLLHYL